jgi:nicotinamidase-related amidase
VIQADRIDPSTTALLVVDVLNDFCDPQGVYGKNGVDVSAATVVVPRIQQLVDAARGRGIRVVFVGTTHSPSSNTEVWLRRRDGRAEEAMVLGTPCAPGTWGAEFHGVSPLEGELVIVKHRYSAFVGTNLDAMLRGHGITSVLCAGVVTEACVESTARDALFLEYHVAIVGNCCASYRPAAHEASLATFAEYFGPVVSLEELEAEWEAAAT